MSFSSFLSPNTFSTVNSFGSFGSDASTWFPKSLAIFLSHPLLFGSIGVTFFGLIGYCTKWMYSMASEAFFQYFVRTLVITTENPEFEWVASLVRKQSWWQSKNLSVDSTINYAANGKGFLEREYQPAIDKTHVFSYKKQLIQVHRETLSNQTKQEQDENTGRVDTRQVEKLTLTTYRCPPNFWDNFLDDASQDGLKDMEKGISIYTPYPHSNVGWQRKVKTRNKRSLESVILEDGVVEKLTKDLSKYNEMGVPYRRGYLLYGPAGTGKTSFITALASHFQLNVCIIALSDNTLNDQYLHKVINEPPNRSLILLEDIDAAFLDREEELKEEERNKNIAATSETGHAQSALAQQQFAYGHPLTAMNQQQLAFAHAQSAYGQQPYNKPRKRRTNVTLSGILNALDGVMSSEKRIVFMTTNYKNKLDSALIRPGRIDFEQYIGHCTPMMFERMFKRFYKDCTNDQCQSFVDLASACKESISPAQLQRHFIRYMDDPQGAVDNFSEIK
uniref:Mitochondrial chaperone BCS1 n=1 Tax=Ditylenchus dipsaci TaxID=166011 RepID=A0A915DB05_9BILA